MFFANKKNPTRKWRIPSNPEKPQTAARPASLWRTRVDGGSADGGEGCARHGNNARSRGDRCAPNNTRVCLLSSLVAQDVFSLRRASPSIRVRALPETPAPLTIFLPVLADEKRVVASRLWSECGFDCRRLGPRKPPSAPRPSRGKHFEKMALAKCAPGVNPI